MARYWYSGYENETLSVYAIDGRFYRDKIKRGPESMHASLSNIGKIRKCGEQYKNKYIRISAGKSMKDVQYETGISDTTICKFENGSHIGVESTKRLTQYYNELNGTEAK